MPSFHTLKWGGNEVRSMVALYKMVIIQNRYFCNDFIRGPGKYKYAGRNFNERAFYRHQMKNDDKFMVEFLREANIY